MSEYTEGCGCCTGTRDRTPQRVVNRPGLAEIAYRAGRYAQLRDSMIAGLTRSDRPALARLRTRDPRDFSLGLIDAWAVAGDVLTFYTERIANEHYLGTATERRSVSGLVGLIGYRLRPGVAAETVLAFTLDAAPTSPAVVPVPTGAKVQTLPGPGQLPQTFETVEDLQARPEWNSLAVRLTGSHVPADGETSVLLEGAATGLHRGDTLLFRSSTATATTGFALVRVTSVTVNPAAQRSLVSFSPALSGLGTAPQVTVWVPRQRAALFGYNAASPVLFVDEVRTALAAADLLTEDKSEWAFSALSSGAVDLDGLYEGVSTQTPAVLVDGAGTQTRLTTIGSVGEAARTAYGISAKVTRLALALTDEDLHHFGGEHTRGTVVLLRCEPLVLAPVPLTRPVHGDTVDLADLVGAALAGTDLVQPRRVLVRGRRPRLLVSTDSGFDVTRDDGTTWTPGPEDKLVVLAIEADALDPDTWHLRVADDLGVAGTLAAPAAGLAFAPAREDDPLVGEVALVEAVDGDRLLLTTPLANAYERRDVTGQPLGIWGNVAAATHGESVVDEVLGSGDASRPFQRFTLRRSPLTHVPAATPAGGASTLRVWVNGVKWQEVASLYGHGPRDRVFTARTADDGTTIVEFGDGASGARLPTGHDNVRATYRVGSGLGGLAAAEQLSLLMTRPLAVTRVVNPLPATGAADPERGEDAASNAPRSVLTLDRVVSLRDYEDFAANIAGVGKASATWTWDGVTRGVLLTVAGANKGTVEADPALLGRVTTAIVAAGNPRVPLAVRSAVSETFVLQATLVTDPAHIAATVLADARTALLFAFSFAARGFGQLVSLSEVAEVLHGVDGVVGAHVTRLHRTGEPQVRHPFLVASSPVPGRPPPATGAELLTLDPNGLTLEVAP